MLLILNTLCILWRYYMSNQQLDIGCMIYNYSLLSVQIELYFEEIFGIVLGSITISSGVNFNT